MGATSPYTIQSVDYAKKTGEIGYQEGEKEEELEPIGSVRTDRAQPSISHSAGVDVRTVRHTRCSPSVEKGNFTHFF